MGFLKKSSKERATITVWSSPEGGSFHALAMKGVGVSAKQCGVCGKSFPQCEGWGYRGNQPSGALESRHRRVLPTVPGTSVPRARQAGNRGDRREGRMDRSRARIRDASRHLRRSRREADGRALSRQGAEP
jgi:hypothetical protein